MFSTVRLKIFKYDFTIFCSKKKKEAVTLPPEFERRTSNGNTFFFSHDTSGVIIQMFYGRGHRNFITTEPLGVRPRAPSFSPIIAR